ncbi:MAG: MBL fold metallo-hydrolase [Bryobacteraceae bacterium]
MEVRCGARVILLDAGTGIRPFGLAFDQEGHESLDLLVSHRHMDHLQGFPFFNPLYRKSTRLRVYMPPHGPTDPFAALRRTMEEPVFPVSFEYIPSQIDLRVLNGAFKVGDVSVKTMPVNHPGGCTAFRLEYQGRSLVYMTDHEPYSRRYGAQVEQAVLDEQIREFARGAELLVRESQYTNEEYSAKRGWGHGTFEDAVLDALAVDVKRLALFHHDPMHDDQFLEHELAMLHQRFAASELEIFLAREGQRVELA